MESPFWKCSKKVSIWHSGIKFTGEHVGAELMVGLNDYRGLFQPKQFCATRYHRNSMAERVKLQIYIYAFSKVFKTI